jgi:hypothetical protein
MKCLILATASAVTLSSFAMASESMVGQDSAGAANFSRVPQQAVTAIKLAMGPTSAAQKPGGVGEEPKANPTLHKKTKHKPKHA